VVSEIGCTEGELLTQGKLVHVVLHGFQCSIHDPGNFSVMVKTYVAGSLLCRKNKLAKCLQNLISKNGVFLARELTCSSGASCESGIFSPSSSLFPLSPPWGSSSSAGSGQMMLADYTGIGSQRFTYRATYTSLNKLV
jgi:hypothetical protein